MLPRIFMLSPTAIYISSYHFCYMKVYSCSALCFVHSLDAKLLLLIFPPLYISYSPNTTVNLCLKVVCLCVPPVLPEVVWSSAVCPEVFQRLVLDEDSQRRLPGHEEGSCRAPSCTEGNTCQETTHCKSLSIGTCLCCF